MRTLNRPMFRYGGPIKEGVMNGIREPKKDGGSMGENQGKYLVGDPIYPKTDGRAHHAIFGGLGIAALGAGAMAAGRAGLRYIPQAIKAGKRIFGKTTTKDKFATAAGPNKRFYEPAGYKVNVGEQVFTPNILGRDPLIQLGGKIIKGVTDPSVTGKLAGAARLVFSPSGAVLGGLYYANGKFFNKKGEPVPKPKGDIKIGGKVGTSGAPGGGDPDMKYNAPPKELTEAEREAATIAARNKQMDMYKEIMDIKGMKKDATYKALIDASQLITAEGDFKGSIKDGSLIAKLIGAADKRFDKVSDTETALRSLVAKGEIEKDMNKDKNALDNAVKNAQLTTLNKNLKGLSTGEIIQKTLGRAGGEYPQGDALRQTISINNPELNAKVLPTGDIPQGMDALDYITQQITTINNDETTPDYPEGFYVIKDRIIKVIDGKVIPISINQLK